MALKPTIYKLHVAISDFNRDYYSSSNLTIALHPSETLERMMARVLAFCLNANENLEFAKGLSNPEEPDVWGKTLDNQIALWVDVGEPQPERIKKASRQAKALKVYSFNSKSSTWWQQNREQLLANDNAQFYQFGWSQMQSLVKLAQRTMDWTLSISDQNVYITDAAKSVELTVTPLL